MTRLFLVAGMIAAIAVPVSAQEPTPFDWAPEHRQLAGRISDGLLLAQFTLDTIDVLRQPDRTAAIKCQSIRYGAALGSSEATKRFVHRTRPDGSDDKSFFSMHTALAFSASGWNVQIGVPLGSAVAYGRMAADKHFMTDVLVGALAGIGALHLCETAQ